MQLAFQYNLFAYFIFHCRITFECNLCFDKTLCQWRDSQTCNNMTKHNRAEVHTTLWQVVYSKWLICFTIVIRNILDINKFGAFFFWDKLVAAKRPVSQRITLKKNDLNEILIPFLYRIFFKFQFIDISVNRLQKTYAGKRLDYSVITRGSRCFSQNL